MDMALNRSFLTLWRKYFNNAELPVTFYYTDEEADSGSVFELNQRRIVS